MAKFSKLFLVIIVLLTAGFGSHQLVYGAELVAQTNELFAVGTVEGTEHSYLYTIHPVTGEIALIGDTGLNNCTGIDFNSEGKLKALCETRDEELVSSKGLLAGNGVICELDTETGEALWTVPHGLSNNISDIAIREDDVLFSYENLDIDNLHRHEDISDFGAQFIGLPDIEALDHGLAVWGDQDLKVAANVSGTPTLFEVNADTGEANALGALNFPDAFGGEANATIASRASVEEVQFASMDTFRIAGVDLPSANTLSAIGAGYAFAESQADFAALMFTQTGMTALPEASTSGFATGWAAIGLVDLETLQVDYIVEVQNPGLVIQAIALRPRPLAQVPTLSEWGLITTAILLFVGGLVFFIRNQEC